MSATNSIRRSPKSSEGGYILVAVIFMLAIFVIAMSVAAPKIAKSIQRDRELETMHRGKQYARAVKLYYKQFNTYPPNLDALVKTNEIRFLRKKYIDPTTGKDEWKIVRFGQQKTQTLGFFGQPIGGTGMVGAGINGGNGMNGANGLPGATSMGGPSGPGGLSGGIFGSSGAAGPNGAGSPNGMSGPTDSPTNQGGAQSPPSGMDGSTTDQSNGQTTGSGGTTPGSGSGFGTPGNGQTMGGMGIMGFSPNSPKQSILVYKKKNHYNEWEFLYDPLADQMMMQGGNTGTIGTPAGGMNGASPIGSGSTFGPGSGTSAPPGGAGPSGPTPIPPSPQSPPQQ